MMTVRAHYIPEELRSTIINCFRIPLNLFVCIILYNVRARSGVRLSLGWTIVGLGWVGYAYRAVETHE
jgi:hypothetical protein